MTGSSVVLPRATFGILPEINLNVRPHRPLLYGRSKYHVARPPPPPPPPRLRSLFQLQRSKRSGLDQKSTFVLKSRYSSSAILTLKSHHAMNALGVGAISNAQR